MNNILQKAGRTCFRLRKILLKIKHNLENWPIKSEEIIVLIFSKKKRKLFLKNWKLGTSQ